MLPLLMLLGCDNAVEGPWQGFSIHPVVETGGTALPQHGSDTPLQVGEAVLDGSCVASAKVSTDAASGSAILTRFTPKCATRLADFTGENIGHSIALVVRGEVYSAPVIMERIEGGEVLLSLGGQYSPEQAERLLVELSGP
ncbi:MAG: preprotein translocase subunit SecD [Myxococcota bacterium]|jgi:preprotein translocase subunit SecD